MHWQQEGSDPDYRFSLANERTFLAWMRTALAVMAGGILVHQFATRIQPPWLISAMSIVFIGIALVVSLGAYSRWRANEIAMRHNRPLPTSYLPPFMAAAVSSAAVGAAAIFFTQ